MRRHPSAITAKTRRTYTILCAAGLAAIAPVAGAAASRANDSSTPPDLIPLLAGYNQAWVSTGPLTGTIENAPVLERDDQLVVWINHNATKAQQFKALQDSEYNDDGDTYDQSRTVSTGMGSELSRLYIKGIEDGALPLTTALVNSETGSTGAYESTSAAKAYFSHPRPFLKTDPNAKPVPGDDRACDPSKTNAASQRDIRVGQRYADAKGNLKIIRVPDVVDKTHQFSTNSVPLTGDYGDSGLCLGGSFPSGHTTTAYEAGITLATLLPQVAPELLARSSENGINRNVLGVHYPLDIMGGRIDGEVALAARWSDAKFRNTVLRPARRELIGYLTAQAGHPIGWIIRHQQAYTSNPFGGKAIPSTLR